MLTKLPGVVGLEEGSKAWVTVVIHGEPVWKRGTVLKLLPNLRFRVEVDGRSVVVRQEDVRSLDSLKLHTS